MRTILRAQRALRVSRRLRGGARPWAMLVEEFYLGRGLSLRAAEKRRIADVASAARGSAVVLGAPRSGSTLLMQLAARCLEVGYVSNFVSKYWLAPVVGWDRQIERGELERQRIPLRSRFGVTPGDLAPHEFGFFWRTWIDAAAADELDTQTLDRAAWGELREELLGLSGWFQAPVILKGINAVSFHVERAAREFQRTRFIHIIRGREATVDSILRARREIHGSEAAWWSIRPAAYREWSALPAREQVERQVDAVRSAVVRDFAGLPVDRRLELDLGELRADPRAVLLRLADFLGVEARLDRLSEEDVLPP